MEKINVLCIENNLNGPFDLFQPGGSASESGGLRIGHVLLQVDGQSLEGLIHNDVAKTIATAFKDQSKHQMELIVMEPNSGHT